MPQLAAGPACRYHNISADGERLAHLTGFIAALRLARFGHPYRPVIASRFAMMSPSATARRMVISIQHTLSDRLAILCNIHLSTSDSCGRTARHTS